MRLTTQAAAAKQAQANADRRGAPWVIFTDTSGCWNAELYNRGMACHNDAGAVLFHPTRTTVQGTVDERKHHVRVASYAVTQELRAGLIDGAQALHKVREIHAAAGWPFGYHHPDVL